MKKSLFATTLFILTLAGAWYFFGKTPTPLFPAPTDKNYREKQEEGEEEHLRREAWVEYLHKAAPGTNWRDMDRAQISILSKSRKSKGIGERGNEVFANGNLEGEWLEKGSRNQSGSMRSVDFDPYKEEIYGVSDGGSLWRGQLDGSQWTVLNDDIRLQPEILKVLAADTGSLRIISAIGKVIVYSDDEGSTWKNAQFSPPFYDGWGHPMYLEALSDSSHSIYYMAYTWDSAPWAPRIWLYRSTDRGENFQRIRIFSHDQDRKISMWSPLQSSELYILNRGQTLFSVVQDSVSPINSVTGLPPDADLHLTGNSASAGITFYALANSKEVFMSADTGATWALKDSLPNDAWSVGMLCSPFDAETLIAGEVNCHRSINGGNDWNILNEWWEYYGDLDLLHADIMDIKAFKKTDGTEFFLIANHGGLHISYDNLESTNNIGLQDLNISQYYDVVTNPQFPEYIYAGSQDQGWQWTSNGSAAGAVDFIQQWSGDYGMMALVNNYESFWTQYPGGIMDYYHYAQAPPNPWPESEWAMSGDDLPAVGWILPTAPSSFIESSIIFIGGGNIYGGPGSYLIYLTAASAPPFTITANQFDFDFKQNSNSGNGLISAIEQSPIDPDRIFVSTDDGTFFYTYDGGATWDKALGFSGPTVEWLYTACILASKHDKNVLWISGSGYSNPPVFKSTDGGKSFIQMSDGLPPTLVQEVVASPDEMMLFAATAVGPFVYIADENKWYDLIGNETPMQWYTCVEFIESESTVRFGTYGRGIWDFKIKETTPSASQSSFNANEISLYPNPAKTSEGIIFKTSMKLKLDFQLFDINGRLVKNESVGDQSLIRLDGVKPGVYYYTALQMGEFVKSGKIIIH